MALEALVDPLLSLPLFRNLEKPLIEEIARHAERVIYAPGDTIAEEDQVSDAAIVVISGACVRVDDGDGIARGAFIAEGSIISELAMLVEVTHTATIIAQGRVRALRLTRERMREMMEQRPALAEHFTAQIIGRLRRLAEDIATVDSALERITMLPIATADLSATAHGGLVH